MRAVDTNVLVRLVTRDDPRQVRAAEAFVARPARAVGRRVAAQPREERIPVGAVGGIARAAHPHDHLSREVRIDVRDEVVTAVAHMLIEPKYLARVLSALSAAIH